MYPAVSWKDRKPKNGCPAAKDTTYREKEKAVCAVSSSVQSKREKLGIRDVQRKGKGGECGKRGWYYSHSHQRVWYVRERLEILVRRKIWQT